MKILIFIIAFLLSLFLIPDSWLYSFIMNNFKISGDGETGMNNLDNTVLMVKIVLSAIVSFFIIVIYPRLSIRRNEK